MGLLMYPSSLLQKQKAEWLQRLQFHLVNIVTPFKTCAGMHEASDTSKTGMVQTFALPFWKILDWQWTWWRAFPPPAFGHSVFPNKPDFPKLLYAQGGDKSIATLKLIQLHSRAPVSGSNTCIAECHRLCFCTCQVSLLLRKQAMARYCDTGVLLYGTSEHSKLYFCFQSLPKVTSLSKGSLYLGKEEDYFLS